jgi:sugar lactone lactonase YvrE
MITLIALSRFISMKANYVTKRKGKTMNPLTHFRKIRILPLLSLGAIFALATSAYAQNLYVSANRLQSLGGHAILEFTPDGTQSTYASGLENPRGLAFDGIGNLFAAEILIRDDHVIGRVLKFNLRNKVSTVGSAANFDFVGLATDMAGNAYVMATDDNSGAGRILKFTPDGDRLIFGTVPGTTGDNLLQANQGLAFDSAGNLYAADGGAQTIFKFAPNGTRNVFVGPSAFAPGAYPTGLTFDSSGNLFVSTECFAPFFCEPGSDTILKFTPTGVGSTFATGLTFPRGLAFDSSGRLFVAEANLPGDILWFPPGGGPPTVFASGFGRPQYLTFGPPR